MFVLLLFLWIIFNGKITVEILLFGIVICAWLYWFMCKYMGYRIDREKIILKNLPLFIRYFFILTKEIIKANLSVMRIILFSEKEIEPAIMQFKTDIKANFARVVLANSITLTPGTYTIQLEENKYLIHALDKSFGEDLNQSVFAKELRKLEAKL